jgi:hypothetical protein
MVYSFTPPLWGESVNQQRLQFGQNDPQVKGLDEHGLASMGGRSSSKSMLAGDAEHSLYLEN